MRLKAAIAPAGVAKHYAKQLELPFVIGGNSRVAIPSNKATQELQSQVIRQLKYPFSLKHQSQKFSPAKPSKTARTGRKEFLNVE
jgi:hypothetical protein